MCGALICLSELAREVEVCMACDCGHGSGERKGCREKWRLLDSQMESLQEEAKEQFPGGFHVTQGHHPHFCLGIGVISAQGRLQVGQTPFLVRLGSLVDLGRQQLLQTQGIPSELRGWFLPRAVTVKLEPCGLTSRHHDLGGFSRLPRTSRKNLRGFK